MRTLTADMRRVLTETDSRAYTKANKLLAAQAMSPKRLTPAHATALRKAHSTIDVFRNGPGAAVESFLTLVGPPLTFAEHRCRMAIYGEG